MLLASRAHNVQMKFNHSCNSWLYKACCFAITKSHATPFPYNVSRIQTSPSKQRVYAFLCSTVHHVTSIPFWKYFLSVSNSSSWAAQVPCFSHSCFQREVGESSPKMLPQYLTSIPSMGITSSSMKTHDLLQKLGPIVPNLVGLWEERVSCYGCNGNHLANWSATDTSQLMNTHVSRQGTIPYSVNSPGSHVRVEIAGVMTGMLEVGHAAGDGPLLGEDEYVPLTGVITAAPANTPKEMKCEVESSFVLHFRSWLWIKWVTHSFKLPFKPIKILSIPPHDTIQF